MKNFLRGALLGLLSSSSVLSAPVEKRTFGSDSGLTDVDVLQFALTLEHLENVFYQQAFQQFTEQDFLSAGFDSIFFNQMQFVAVDELQHVQFLEQAITSAGGTPVLACEYNFPFTDVNSFVALASVIEGIGVSAYLGGASIVSSKDILTAAASIMVAESIHQGIIRDSLSEVASGNIVGTAIDPTSIFSIASAFISSCPQGNVALPFQAFPGLLPTESNFNSVGSLSSFSLAQEQSVQVVQEQQMFLTFVSGLQTVSVAAQFENNVFSAGIPESISGQTFVFMTNEEITSVIQDSNIMAGPAIIEVTPGSPSLNFGIH